MQGVGHRDLHPLYFLGTTLVHGRNVFRALLLQPSCELEDADDFRLKLPDDLDGIADMVEVPMGSQQDIDFLLMLLALRTHRVLPRPWIDDNGFSFRRLDAECGMTEPCDVD